MTPDKNAYLISKVGTLKNNIEQIWDSEPLNQSSSEIHQLLTNDYGEHFLIYGVVPFNEYINENKEDLTYQAHRLGNNKIRAQSWQAVKDDVEKIRITTKSLSNAVQHGTPLANINTGDFLSKRDVSNLIDDLDAAERDRIDHRSNQ